jgi:hypothetical protein
MAEMIPDRLPSRASKGEEKVFELLKKLPDGCLVYYEPIIRDRYPDFIVMMPDLGLLVIEVKGWYPADILAADNNNVTMKRGADESSSIKAHPCRQGREYMFKLMDACKEHPNHSLICHAAGEHQNELIFPFAHMAVLSNITGDQLRNHPAGDLSAMFPPEKVLPRDILISWENVSGSEIEDRLKSFFNPFWVMPHGLNSLQIALLRSIIHPEVTLPPAPGPSSATDDNLSLQVLDLRQEALARKIGRGHRIITGVAGSGKTVLLISRAKWLAEELQAKSPEGKILVLCYNVTLCAYLRSALSGPENISVLHFDAWARENSCPRDRGETNEHLGERFLQKFTEGYAPDSRRYFAAFIDEAQDFPGCWFKCVVQAIEEPLDGDLLIVADASQGLYKPFTFKWGDVGIQARGRVLSRNFGLDKNYRNSETILDLAWKFVANSADLQETLTGINENPEKEIDGIVSIPPETAVRKGGNEPVIRRNASRTTEVDTVIDIVRDLLAGKWFSEALVSKLDPHQIAILYPMKMDRPEFSNAFSRLRQGLKGIQGHPEVVWLNENPAARWRVNEPGIKIQTIHSSKGLQYRAVIVMWADLLPKPFGDIDEQRDRKLLYVAMTRAEDLLAITYCGSSRFMTELEKSLNSPSNQEQT